MPAAKSLSRWTARSTHRVLGGVVLLFFLYFATTGTMIQLVDLRALLTHAPATNPEMVQIREGIDGPGNFVVIGPKDFAAAPLPADLPYGAALATVLRGVQEATGNTGDLRYVELRMAGQQPVGVVRSGDTVLRVDARSGALLAPPVGNGAPVKSLHLQFKVLHTLRGAPVWTLGLRALVGIALFLMVVTGLVLYFQLLRARSRAGLPGLFWSAGGPTRSMHRAVSILAAVFLLVISATGTWITLEGVTAARYRVTHKNAGKYSQFPWGSIGDMSSPLPVDKLPGMLQTTLSAATQAAAVPVKAVRLRYFYGIPQGVVIAGNGDTATQVVFHAETGRRMGMTEPEYPKTHYRFGWANHELVKRIHRGDFFGLPGRFMDLFGGLSLIYLSLSGGWMYFDLWRRRSRAGRPALVWR